MLWLFSLVTHMKKKKKPSLLHLKSLKYGAAANGMIACVDNSSIIVRVSLAGAAFWTQNTPSLIHIFHMLKVPLIAFSSVEHFLFPESSDRTLKWVTCVSMGPEDSTTSGVWFSRYVFTEQGKMCASQRNCQRCFTRAWFVSGCISDFLSWLNMIF